MYKRQPLINDKEAADEADIIARRILPAEDIIHDKEKSLGADDFADFLAVKMCIRDSNSASFRGIAVVLPIY